MTNLKFGACEHCFPVWGPLAIEMAGEAGFKGMQITDGGGYLQPHPLNNGFVEYERFGLDLRRKDSFPLTDPWVQGEYLEAAAKFGVELTGIFLYLLGHQGFVKFSGKTPQGQQCLESIRNAIIAAARMNIPLVSIPVKGMFGVGQHAYALEKLQFAVQVAEEYGVQIAMCADTAPERQLEVLNALGGKVKLDFCTIDPVLYATGDAPHVIGALGGEWAAQFRMRDQLADEEGFLTTENARMSLLGHGDAGFRECAQAIKTAGFSGWVLSETAYYSADLNRGGADYISLASKDVETLQQAFCGESREGQNAEI